MNATSTFAAPPIARSGFSTHTARQQAAWSLGDHAVTGTTTERTALFGASRLLPAQQFLPDGENPTWSGRSHNGFSLEHPVDQRIPPVPDLALSSHSTGAKP